MRRDVVYLAVLLLAGIPALSGRPQQFSYNFQPSHHWRLTDLNYLNAFRNLPGPFQSRPSTPTTAAVSAPASPSPIPPQTATIRRPENVQARVTPAPVQIGSSGAGGQSAGFAPTQPVGTAAGQFISVNPQSATANGQRSAATQSSFRSLPSQTNAVAVPSIRVQQPAGGNANAASGGGGSVNGNRVTGVGVSSASAQNGGLSISSGQGSGVSRPSGSLAGGTGVSFSQGSANPAVNSPGTSTATRKPQNSVSSSAFRPSQPLASSGAVGGGSGSAANGQVTAVGTSVANAQNGGTAVSSGKGVGASSPSGSSASGNGQSLTFGPTRTSGHGGTFAPQGGFNTAFRPSQPIFFDNTDAIGTGSGSAGNGQATGFGSAVSSAQNGGVGLATGQGSGTLTPAGSSATGSGNSFASGSPVIVGTPVSSAGAAPLNPAATQPLNIQTVSDSANLIVANTNSAIQELVRSIFSSGGFGVTPIFGNLVFGNGQSLALGGLVHLEPTGSGVSNPNAESSHQIKPVITDDPQNSAETSISPVRPTQPSVPGNANAEGSGTGSAGTGQASGIGTAFSSAQNGGAGLASGHGSGSSNSSGNFASGIGNSIATGTQLRMQVSDDGSSALGTGTGSASNGLVSGSGIAISNSDNDGIGIASGQGSGSSSSSENLASGAGNSQTFGSSSNNAPGFFRMSSTVPPFALSIDEPTGSVTATTSSPLETDQLDAVRGSGGSGGSTDSGLIVNIPSGGITIPPSLSSALATFFGNLITSSRQNSGSIQGFPSRTTEHSG